MHQRNKVPQAVQATHMEDHENHTVRFDYNGKPLLTLFIPEGAKPYYRQFSNGNIQSSPLVQQLYLVLDQPATIKARFHLSKDAINMRPNRAESGQAILGQIGKPLLEEVNGLYDVLQDLLIDWHGAKWKWIKPRLELDDDENWQAELDIEAGLLPWIVNLRMHYYRKHMQYENHRPWEWRPQLQAITGWSSWEAFAQHVTGEDIERTAAFLETHLKPYGLEYMQIDDGYQSKHIPPSKEGIVSDAWLQTNERFTGQHDGILSSIHGRGFQAAIWTSAMVTNQNFVEGNPECFERDSNGDPLQGPWIYYVLKGDPGTLAEQAAPLYKGLKERGYSYFKTDQIRHYLYDGLHKAVNEGLMTGEEASLQLRNYLQCARDNIGNDAYFLACWGVLTEAVGVVDACRIAGDSNPTWPAICKQMVETARWYHTQRILYLNDPDYVCMRTDTAWGKSLLSLVSLSGGLLMISDNTDLYDADRIYAIQRCMPSLSTTTGETGHLDMTYPLDLSLPPVGNDPDRKLAAAFALLGMDPAAEEPYPTASLWAVHFDLPYRSWCVAGRFAVVPLPQAELGLEALALAPNEVYHAFDFWEQRYLGTVSASIELKPLELGHCQIIGFSKAESHPQLIASSRHVSMDAVSVRHTCWANHELVLELNGVAGAVETYWITIPPAYTYTEYSSVGLVPDAIQMEGALMKLNIAFEEEAGRICLKFLG